MTKINIIIAVFSIVSGLGNLIIGTGSEHYAGTDIALAALQVILASLVIITGFSNLDILFRNKLFSRAHHPISIIFYAFIVIGTYLLTG